MMKKKIIIPYSLKKTPLQWSWLLLGSFLFFSFGGKVVLGLEKNYIDIKGSLYHCRDISLKVFVTPMTVPSNPMKGEEELHIAKKR